MLLYLKVSANGVSTCQFTVESNEDDIDDEVCYIGKDMCICLNGCKCKSRAVHMNLFDPAVVSLLQIVHLSNVQ